MYTFWKRAAPPASMDIFNAPSRETCTVRRERTNTPLQALVTLNDPQFVEAARILAQTTLKEGGDNVDEPHRLHRPPAAGPAVPAEELKVVQRRRSTNCWRYYKAHARRCEETDRGRRIEGRPDAGCRDAWPPGPCWQTS